MPKGYTYDCEITGREGELHKYNNLTMKNLQDELQKKINEIYCLEMTFSNHRIYNIINRPQKVSKIIRDKIKVSHCIK